VRNICSDTRVVVVVEEEEEKADVGSTHREKRVP
jgi:hypothetical protein